MSDTSTKGPLAMTIKELDDDCACGGGAISGHATGCPEAARFASPELVERLRASIVVTSEGKGLRMSLSADDVEAAADQLTALTAERDEALRKSEERWQVAIAMADDYNTLMAKVALLIEALEAMPRRFEIYAGPNDKHAGHHGLALLQTARRALSEPDKEGA